MKFWLTELLCLFPAPPRPICCVCEHSSVCMHTHNWIRKNVCIEISNCAFFQFFSNCKVSAVWTCSTIWKDTWRWAINRFRVNSAKLGRSKRDFYILSTDKAKSETLISDYDYTVALFFRIGSNCFFSFKSPLMDHWAQPSL